MKRFIFVLIIIGFCFYLYAKYINVNGLNVKEYEITSSKIIDDFNGFKIVHFTDFLYKNSSDLNELKIVANEISKQKPNMVVFTGDLLKSNIKSKDMKEMTQLLASIKADYKYAITGDNDTNDTMDILTNSDFNVLDNNYAYVFNKNTSPLKIIDGNHFSEEILNNEDDITPFYIIALVHKPDNFNKLNNYNLDLVLAGHSLGGQIRLPFWGALIKKDGAKTYTDDFYNENDTSLYVSFGIGTEKTPLRAFNKPSINVYRLNSK